MYYSTLEQNYCMHILFCDFQLFLKAVKTPFNLGFFSSDRKACKDEDTESMLRPEDEVSFW